jgi:putative transposase
MIVGDVIGRSIDARLTVAALKSVLARREPPPGCIHHSDCGSEGRFKWSSQYSERGGCDEYSEAAVGSLWTGAIAIAGTTAHGGTR